MGTTSRLSQVEWEMYLKRVLNGETLTALASEANYGLSFFSIKLKKVATNLNLLEDYQISLYKQRITRQGGIDRSDIYRKYVDEAKQKITQWKPIIDFENYHISDSGLIINTDTGRYLRPSISKKNHTMYVNCVLYKNGKNYNFPVHRLVLTTFNPTTDNTLQVDHLDNNGLNNHISNLEWVTAAQNIQRSFERNSTSKKQICSEGGKISGQIQKEKAIKKYTQLLGNRFISLQNGIITYICENCMQQFQAECSSKAFRCGWKGVCTPCKREITRQKRLNEKSN